MMCPGLPTSHSPHTGKHPNTQPQSSLWRPPGKSELRPTVCIFNFKWCFKKTLSKKMVARSSNTNTLIYISTSIRVKMASIKFPFHVTGSNPWVLPPQVERMPRSTSKTALMPREGSPSGSCSCVLAGMHIGDTWPLAIYTKCGQRCFLSRQ